MVSGKYGNLGDAFERINPVFDGNRRGPGSSLVRKARMPNVGLLIKRKPVGRIAPRDMFINRLGWKVS